MTDWPIEEQSYTEKTSHWNLVKSRLILNERGLQVLIPLIVFFLALLPRILNLDAFITADEDDQIMFASSFLKSVLRGDFRGALILGYPGVPTLLFGAVGVGFRYLFHYMGWYPLSWVTTDFFTTLDQVTARFGMFDYPLDFLVWVRVPMVLAASLAILGIYLLTKRLVNTPVALIAALILAFDPFILAHSRVIHVDAPMAYFMILSFLSFLLYLDRGVWGWLVLSGLLGGLAGLSKTPAALLGPILVITGVIYALLPPAGQAKSVRWKRLVIALVVWGIIAVTAIYALWPAMWTGDIPAIIGSLLLNAYSIGSDAHPTSGIFWGGQQSDQNPFYYLIVFPYHLTPLTTLGVFAGLVMTVTGLADRWRKIDSWVAQILPLALGLIAYVVIFMAPISTSARRGDRYILPIFFAVGIFSALSLWWLAGVLVNRWPGIINRLKLTRTRLVGVALFLQILSILFYHPYYLAYFNPIIGGPWTAPFRINVGWGEGLDRAAHYLNLVAAEKNEKPLVASWYGNQFAPYYQGQTIDLSSQQSALTSDYTVFYINQVQRGFPSKEILDYFRQREPEHIVHLKGIEYAWLYPGPVISQKPVQKEIAFPMEALLGGKARLYGVDVPAVEISSDKYAVSALENSADDVGGYQQKLKGLPVTLYWETLGNINTNHGKLNVYIQLVDEHGTIWGQIDRLILAGLWRTNRWRAGYFIQDEYKLPINPATPPGQYHLEIGLYDFETGQNYGVVKNVGQLTLTPPVELTDPNELKVNTRITEPVNKTLTLVGHDYGNVALPPGGEIVGKIFWQATNDLDKNYTLEFSFLGPGQKRYIVHENQSLSSNYPVSMWRKSEIVGQSYRFRVPAVAPPGQYPMQVTVINSETGDRVGEPVTLANITVKELERNFDLPDNVVPMSVIIKDEVELVGYKLHNETVKARETFGLTLYWRSLGFADSNYTVFVHAVGPDQTIRGQWDSMPVQGTSPTSGWIPGEVIEDHFEVLMERDIPPWKYDIFVGLYNPVTGNRLPMFSPKAPLSDNRVWLTRIQAVEE